MTIEQAADHTAFHEFELSRWEAVAGEYTKYWVALTDQAAPYLLNAVDVKVGTSLLDVACGPGGVTALAASRNAGAIGVDFSPQMVAMACAQHPHLRFFQGDAEHLPYEDESFDAVVMNFGMLHLPSPASAIAEAYRVLRPGGRFAFTVWDTPEQAKGFAITLEAVRAHGAAVTVPQGPDFFAFADEKFAAEAVQQARFVEPTTETVALVWHLADPAEVFDAFLNGTARTGAVIRQQTVEAQRRISTAMTADAASFAAVGGGVEIPMPARMTSARKP